VLQSKLPPELLHEGERIAASPEWARATGEEIKEMLIARLLGQEESR